jgi:hypothetical protein
MIFGKESLKAISVIPPEMKTRAKASTEYLVSKLVKSQATTVKNSHESFYSDSEEEQKGEEGILGKKGPQAKTKRMQYKEIKFGKVSEMVVKK